MNDHSIRMSDFVDDVHRAIDKAIVRDHETARQLPKAPIDGLREALEKALASLPVVTHDNGYRVQALPKSELLDILAAHPAEPAPVANSAHQPVVDREVVAAAMHDYDMAHSWRDERLCPSYACVEVYPPRADALIAAVPTRDAAEVRKQVAEEIAEKLDMHGYEDAAQAIRNRNLG